MRFIILGTVLGLFVAPALSGVLTFTSQGIQYLNNEQFAALQDPNGQQNQQGLWRDDGSGGVSGGESAPQVQEYDDDENQSEQEDGDDEEVDEAEEKDDDDEIEDEPVVADDSLPDDVPVVKGSKYSVKTKGPKGSKPQKKSPKKKHHKVKESDEGDDEVEPEADDAEADGEEKPRPPPPMPDVLKQEMMSGQYNDQHGQPSGQYGQPAPYGGQPGQYGQSVGGVQGGQPGGAGAPLLSRMTSFLGSLLGRGGIGSDPIYMNRNAKSISSAELVQAVEREAEASLEPLTRTKRQMKLGGIQIQPFYHVRNNIRTMVRRQPNTKLSLIPVDDFSTLSEKESKPIKLFMEPYAAPATYQSQPISPAQGVRGPSSSGLTRPASGSSGLGQGVPQQSSSTNKNGGGKEGSSGGQKKNNNKNKGSGNKEGDKESEEEDDSDENSSDQYPNYGEEDEESNSIVSGEDYGGHSGLEEDDEDDEYDYEDEARK